MPMTSSHPTQGLLGCPARRTVARRRVNRALLALWTIALLPLQAAAAPASAPRVRDALAEQFVESQAQRIVATLANRRLGEAEKRRVFRQAVDEVVDVPRVTTFVLGKYARTISPADRQAFAVVFREYAQGVYEKRIGDYRGETVTVTGSVARKPGDVVVFTALSGGSISQPLPVAWRVLNGAGGWKVVDVQVKGVWLAITQQQDFVSTIDNAGGNVGALTAQLKRAAVAAPPSRR